MSDKNRERILAAAREILVQKGSEQLTMEDTASLAKVTRKTVYNYYQSKALLLDAVMERFAHESIAALEQIVENNERSFADKLNDVIETGFSWIRSWERMFRRPGVYLCAKPCESAGPGIREYLRGFIERIVRDAFDAGIVDSSFDPRRMAWVFINMVEGLIRLDHMEDEDFGKTEILRDSLRAVIAGILNAEGRELMKNSMLFSESLHGQ